MLVCVCSCICNFVHICMCKMGRYESTKNYKCNFCGFTACTLYVILMFHCVVFKNLRLLAAHFKQ